MDVGIRSPLLDFFRRGEVAKDVRLLAARGALAPRAHEQIALLALLTEDGDAEVRGAAEATLAAIPNESLAAFLGRSDVPDGLRDFFARAASSRCPGGDADADDPLVDRRPRRTPEAPRGRRGVAGEGDDERAGRRSAAGAAERRRADEGGDERHEGRARRADSRSQQARVGVGAEQPEAHAKAKSRTSRRWRTSPKKCCGSSA